MALAWPVVGASETRMPLMASGFSPFCWGLRASPGFFAVLLEVEGDAEVVLARVDIKSLGVFVGVEYVGHLGVEIAINESGDGTGLGMQVEEEFWVFAVVAGDIPDRIGHREAGADGV